MRHVKFSDRKKIEYLAKSGKEIKDISQITGFHIATIYRELKKGQPDFSLEKEKSHKRNSVAEHIEVKRLLKSYSAVIAEENKLS